MHQKKLRNVYIKKSDDYDSDSNVNVMLTVL